MCHPCSTYSHRSLPDALSTSPNLLREDIKRLKLLELQLKDAVKTLAQQRDGLVMELQQLQEAKPVLEKAYAVRWYIWIDSYFPCKNKTYSFLSENTASKFDTAHPTAGG